MTNQTSNQAKQERPPYGFYALMGTLAVCLATVIFYLIASYFAK
jgi:hypothetical protein